MHYEITSPTCAVNADISSSSPQPMQKIGQRLKKSCMALGAQNKWKKHKIINRKCKHDEDHARQRPGVAGERIESKKRDCRTTS
jgi:hypothetical protein